MFQRFHEKLQEKEGGFTLIELLVVILIIAILAAIAIPVFLAQRKKGWVAQTESALKNAATAQESFLVGNPAGIYADTEVELEGQRFKKAASVTLTVAGDAADGYCMEGTHTNLTDAAEVWTYNSEVGKPVKDGGTCV